MKIINRIVDLLEKNRTTAYKLSKALGINGSTFATWKKNEKDPPAAYLPTIAEFFGVSINYLVTGKEAPEQRYTSTLEDELIDLYRQLPERQQYEYIGELKGYIKNITENKYVDSEKKDNQA